MSARAGRVLTVLGELDPEVLSGATRSLMRAVPELEERGWEFTFWTALPSATARELQQEGREVHGGPRQLRFSIRQLRSPPGVRQRLRSAITSLRGFDRFLREASFDLVLGNTVGTLPELAIAHRRGCATLLHVLEVLPDRPRYTLARRALRRVSDGIMAPSHACADQFAGAEPEPSVVNTGIAVPEDAVEAANRHREQGTERLVVGAMGTISKRKGTDLLVAAAERWRDAGVNVDVRLCGRLIEGDERTSARDVLARSRRAGITYQERVDPFQELPGWDIVVVPSRQDPFPNVVLEAMAIGVPVVATRVGGIPEQLDDVGVLVPPDDAGELERAVVELLADPVRRRALAEAGRVRAAKRFSASAQAAATDVALRRAIEDHAGA